MDVLVVGSGGREHALCRAFRRSPKAGKLYCASGNAGIAQDAECVAIAPDDIKALADFAQSRNIGLTFIGGEVPLALGVGDEFAARGLNAIAPSRDASQLESSKSFAKDFMARHGVPTPRYVTAHSPDFAILELESGDFGDESAPVVVKADGLAAGKGVVVAKNRADAIAAISGMSELVGTAAAEKIVLEECLTGHEVSLLAFVDGENFALMPPVRDHKRIGDGDTGPNTGGMGTITDASLLNGDELTQITEAVIRPTLHGCIREGFRYRGVLFLGLMMTKDGPQLLEYNVRFGDPETQAILVRLEADLVDICGSMISGTLASSEIKWRPGSSACVVLAAEGYPGKVRTGDVIDGAQDMPTGVEVFHAGTALDPQHRFITNGGRVLGVTAAGDDLASTLDLVYSGVGRISWPGMQYRHDIGK
ncbi:MAG: phosphoribosylamine--glycine ligase [Acidobacteria bacterium]|nr:phosphoribosylamine--glycine ligase [Acidobacteriota bacterium]